MKVTDNSIVDAPVLPDLLNQIPLDVPISDVSGGADYGTRPYHETIALRHALENETMRCRGTKRDPASAAPARTGIMEEVERLSPT